jgi:hypothetical protein
LIMQTMIARHRVRDHGVWRKFFDEYEGKRREYGITNPRVYHNAADQNDLVILFDIADEARVKEFGASDDLAQVAEKAGVVMDTFTIQIISDPWP